MPKVDPESNEPVTDAPSGDDETRGGKVEGDPDLKDATETGGEGPLTR